MLIKRRKKNIINFMRIYWFFIWRNLNPLHPRKLVPSLLEIGQVVLEKKMRMWKVYKRTDRQTDRQTTDDRWSEKLTWAFSLGELKKQWMPFAQECSMPIKFDWIWPTGTEREDLKIISKYFQYVYISSKKKNCDQSSSLL